VRAGAKLVWNVLVTLLHWWVTMVTLWDYIYGANASHGVSAYLPTVKSVPSHAVILLGDRGTCTWV